MKTKLFFLLFIVFSSLTQGQIVINEIDPDTPSTDQKEIIENSILTWKSDYEQIDDILIMGIKL